MMKVLLIVDNIAIRAKMIWVMIVVLISIFDVFEIENVEAILYMQIVIGVISKELHNSTLAIWEIWALINLLIVILSL